MRYDFEKAIGSCLSFAEAPGAAAMTMEALMERIRAKADSQKGLADTSKIVSCLSTCSDHCIARALACTAVRIEGLMCFAKGS